jgi:glycosyltransferase involved in cell wall biosynthesis
VFLALTRPRFAHTPVMAYFHENQVTYPRLQGTKFNSWFGAMNYLSALAADRVAFNSGYHRDDFLGALHSLSSEPNNWLSGDGIGAIETKSDVLPVGVELAWLDRLHPPVPDTGPPIVLWNHRWEFDKAPDVFARAFSALFGDGLPFRLAVGGDPGPNPHPALLELRDLLPDRIVQFGRAETREAYGDLLWRSSLVVSTTRHEFFGVGMVEALYCQCFPIAPRNFNYPALVPPELHATCLFEDEADLRDKLREAIESPRDSGDLLRASASRFRWEEVAPAWDLAIDALALCPRM